jgi:hypothetical protein
MHFCKFLYVYQCNYKFIQNFKAQELEILSILMIISKIYPLYSINKDYIILYVSRGYILDIIINIDRISSSCVQSNHANAYFLLQVSISFTFISFRSLINTWYSKLFSSAFNCIILRTKRTQNVTGWVTQGVYLLT